MKVTAFSKTPEKKYPGLYQHSRTGVFAFFGSADFGLYLGSGAVVTVGTGAMWEYVPPGVRVCLEND